MKHPHSSKEEIAKLTKENAGLRSKLGRVQKENRELRKSLLVVSERLGVNVNALAEAKKGLEFYGQTRNWMQVIDGQYNLGKIWVFADHENRFIDDSITTENGAHAREALKKTEEILGGGK